MGRLDERTTLCIKVSNRRFSSIDLIGWIIGNNFRSAIPPIVSFLVLRVAGAQSCWCSEMLMLRDADARIDPNENSRR